MAKKILKPIHAFEQLALIEGEKDVLKKQKLLKQYGALSPLSWILSLNFRDDLKMELPEGMPPIGQSHLDALTHPDFMGLLASGIVRLKNCMVGVQISKNKKEEIFYDCLINCPLQDAEILCSAKDKALSELYPSITAELVESVFPTYVNSPKKVATK